MFGLMLSTWAVRGEPKGCEGAALAGSHDSNKAEICFIDLTEDEAEEMDSENLLVGRLQRDGLSSQRLSYKNSLPPPTDVTTPSHFAGFEVARVIRSWCTSRERAVIPAKDIRRPFHADRLMRPFHVVAVNEFVERLLLRSERDCRRPRRLTLEVQVHALVAAVVLRMCRPAEDRENTKHHQLDAHR